MKFIKALFLLVWRTVRNFYISRLNYVRNKLKYWGKLRFNFSVGLGRDSTFEGANSIGENSYFSGMMGYGTYMCSNCSIVGNIGRFCSIASDVKNSQGVHPIDAPFVTTSPMFYSLRKQTGSTFAKKQLFDELKEPIEIGHDCWIGQHAFIVGGVKVGTGAVVLAGAVVTKDVPPYAVVGGIPARVLRYRYDEETIKFLLKSEWWNFQLDWLGENYELLSNINEFKRVINAVNMHKES